MSSLISSRTYPVFSLVPDYQRNIENYRYPLLSAKRSEIEERADLFISEDEEEQSIRQLFNQIHKGNYSDLVEGSPNFGELSYYPASNGLHVNEGHKGLNAQIDLYTYSTGGVRMRRLAVLAEELSMMSVSLPGHNNGPCSPSCGKRLPHGDIKASLDKRTVKKAPEQFCHCNNNRCPICHRYHTFVKSDDYAQRLWATRDNLARRGYSPVCYQVVLSPPQRDKDPAAYLRWFSVEGLKDLRRMAVFILKELGSLGGCVVVHHFRQNGEDGIENAGTTGNNGNPYDWRVALHCHSLALFDGYVDSSKIRGIYEKYGWTVKVVLPRKKNGSSDWKDARIKSIQQLRKKLFYLQSHASIMTPDKGGRALDSITWFEGATHKRLREIYGPSKHPLMIEGYTETDEEGRVLYWYEDALRFAPMDLLTLAEVERINSARVFVDASDYEECSRIVRDLRKELDVPRNSSIPPADLWRVIGSDPRFITSFLPHAEPDSMRSPRADQVDGRELWVFRDGSVHEVPEDDKQPMADFSVLAEKVYSDDFSEDDYALRFGGGL